MVVSERSDDTTNTKQTIRVTGSAVGATIRAIDVNVVQTVASGGSSAATSFTQGGSFITSANQSGSWYVGQSGPFNVGQTGLWSVGQSGPFSVGQTGAWYVGQSGPINVGQTGNWYITPWIASQVDREIAVTYPTSTSEVYTYKQGLTTLYVVQVDYDSVAKTQITSVKRTS